MFRAQPIFMFTDIKKSQMLVSEYKFNILLCLLFLFVVNIQEQIYYEEKQQFTEGKCHNVSFDFNAGNLD